MLLSGNLQYRTEVASVRIYGFNQDGNRASASAIAAILLVVALLVIVVPRHPPEEVGPPWRLTP